MRDLIYKCDVCRKAKEEVNHWFIVIRGADIKAPNYDSILGQKFNSVFLVFQWGENLAATEIAHHVCGQAHALELASRWMHNGTLERVTPEMVAV